MEDMFYKRESFVCCAQHCGGFQGLCVVSTFIRGIACGLVCRRLQYINTPFLCSFHTNTPSLALVYISSKKIFLLAHQFFAMVSWTCSKASLPSSCFIQRAGVRL